MNKRVITIGHVVALAVFLLIGLFLVVEQDYAGGTQNSNQTNGNSNRSRNTNSSKMNSNMSSNMNSNSNMSSNMNSNSNMSATSGMSGTGSGALSSSDQKFVMEAAMGGMMEVELGRRAAQQGTSDAVKQFGQRMADDHSKANAELMTIASSKGITLPTDVDAKHRAMIGRLARLTGPAFDKAYAKEMVSDHNKDVSAFQKEAANGGDPDVKGFAAKTLPTLQEHQTMANAVNSTLNPSSKKSGGNSNSSGNVKSNSNSNQP
jgi:putative membrane protein